MFVLGGTAPTRISIDRRVEFSLKLTISYSSFSIDSPKPSPLRELDLMLLILFPDRLLRCPNGDGETLCAPSKA